MIEDRIISRDAGGRATVDLTAGPPCVMLVFTVEGEPFWLSSDREHFPRIMASLSDEWRELLVRALEAQPATDTR
jgi:hypothetical protein